MSNINPYNLLGSSANPSTKRSHEEQHAWLQEKAKKVFHLSEESAKLWIELSKETEKEGESIDEDYLHLLNGNVKDLMKCQDILRRVSKKFYEQAQWMGHYPPREL